MSKFLSIVIISFFWASCSYDAVYEGCGFSIILSKEMKIYRHVHFESISYDFEDETNNLVMWLVLKNDAFSGLDNMENNFFGDTSELSNEFILLYKYDDVFKGLDTLQNKKFISKIYGTKLNDFPIYAQFFYIDSLENNRKIQSIINSLKPEKVTISSEQCR